MVDSEVSRLEAYVEILGLLEKHGLDEKFIVEHFTVKAARPLISAKDRTPGLNYVTACLKRGETITTGALQSSLGAFEKRSRGQPAKTPQKSKPHVGTDVKELDKSNTLGETKITETPKKPSYNGTPQPVHDPEPVPPPVTVAAAMKERYTPPENKPLATVEKLPCQCGKPCPEGRHYLVRQPTLGDKCDQTGSLVANLTVCPVIQRQKAAQANAGIFATGATINAVDIALPATAGKILKEFGTVKIVKAREPISWMPSGKQWEFIDRIIKSGEFDTPAEVVSAAIDRAMEQEGS